MSPLVNNVPPRTCASEVVWPSYLQVHSTTTSSRDHVWTWQQQRDPHTEMKCISLGYALYCPAWPEQTWAMLFETIDMMPLVSYPGLRDQFLSFMGAANSGFFSCVSTASCKCWGKNGQGKSLGDTRIKNTVRSIVSQACVAGKANSKSRACFYIPTYQC